MGRFQALALALVCVPTLLHASSIRVGVLGYPGLVPDGYADLDYNPAYAAFCGRLAFLGVDGSWFSGSWESNDRLNGALTNTYDSDTTTWSVLGEAGVVLPRKPLFLALRWRPAYSDYDVRALSRDLSLGSESRNRSHQVVPEPGDHLATLCFMPGDSLAVAVTAGLDTVWRATREYADGERIASRDSSLDYMKVGAGLVWLHSPGSRVGFSGLLTGGWHDHADGRKMSGGSWDERRTSAYWRGYEARVTPDLSLGGGVRLRSYFSVLWTNAIPENDGVFVVMPWYPAEVRVKKYWDVQQASGAGLEMEGGGGRRWFLGLQSGGRIYFRDKREYDNDVNTPDDYTVSTDTRRNQRLSMRAGLEQELWGDRLVLRLGADLLDWDIFSETKGTDDGPTGQSYTRTGWSEFSLAPGGYSIGLGALMWGRMELDLNISSVRYDCYAYEDTRGQDYWGGREEGEWRIFNHSIGLEFGLTCPF